MNQSLSFSLSLHFFLFYRATLLLLIHDGSSDIKKFQLISLVRGVSEKYPTCVYIIFFDCEGVVHYEFAARGQKINKEYYVEVLKRLRDAVRRKRPCFWSSGDWLLHDDNARAHSSNLVQQFLAKHKIVQLCQPPYSPDIASCDFWMFPKLKMALKGKRFDDIETIQSNATRELKAIPKSTFEDCFKMWKHRWEHVVQSNRDYFEGCHGPDDEE